MELPEWLSLLACPRCKGALTPSSATPPRDELECASCRLAYPFQDGVPRMLADEARPL